MPFRLAGLHFTARPGQPTALLPVSPSACGLLTSSPGFLAGDDFTGYTPGTAGGDEFEAEIAGAGTNPAYQHDSGAWENDFTIDALVTYCGHQTLRATAGFGEPAYCAFGPASSLVAGKAVLWVRQAVGYDAAFATGGAAVPFNTITYGEVGGTGWWATPEFGAVFGGADGYTADGVYASMSSFVSADAPNQNAHAHVEPAVGDSYVSGLFRDRFCEQIVRYDFTSGCTARVWSDRVEVGQFTRATAGALAYLLVGHTGWSWDNVDSDFFVGMWEVIDGTLDPDPYGLLP